MLHKAQIKGTPENFRKDVSRDLNITEEVADRFWNGFRLGPMHAFHPKNYAQDAGQGDAWGWAIAEGVGFDAFPVVEKKPRNVPSSPTRRRACNLEDHSPMLERDILPEWLEILAE